MTAPYDWARDPLATARPELPQQRPARVGVLPHTRCVVPAVWVRQQPALAGLWRLDRRYGMVQLQWRRPRRPQFFRRS